MTRFAFRADASNLIGSGHVMRCLTLADALHRRGGEVRFLCRQQPGNLGEVIAARGYGIDWLPADVDATRDAELCGGFLRDGVDALVVDHYGLDAGWEAALRPQARTLLAIDDLADRPHDCDLLLDQNWFADPAARYAGRLPTRCRTLLGPAFALLKPDYRQRRPLGVDRTAPVRRVLVFFGGADPANLTLRALRALEAHPEIAVDVVAGHAHTAPETLRAWCAVRANATLHSPSERFAELMAAADLAIGAGGATTWERCCLGLPALVLGLAANQYAVAEALGSHGAHLYLGPAEAVSERQLGAALETLLAAPSLRQGMADKGRALVDGHGVERVADWLAPPADLSVRSATPADCDAIYAWRNAPATRQYFFDPTPVDLATHRAWYAQALADPDRVLLVGSLAGSDVGVVRYDLAGDAADISVYLDPARRGQGLGRRLLMAGSRWMVAHRPAVRHLNGHVRPDNRASCAAFRDAGFSERSLHFRLSL